jgi:hypothetical protein
MPFQFSFRLRITGFAFLLLWAYQLAQKLASKGQSLHLEEVSTTCGSGWVTAAQAIMLKILNNDG